MSIEFYLHGVCRHRVYSFVDVTESRIRVTCIDYHEVSEVRGVFRNEKARRRVVFVYRISLNLFLVCMCVDQNLFAQIAIDRKSLSQQ